MRDKQNLTNWKKAKGKTPTSAVKCPLCDKAFKSLDYLELHLKIAHPGVSNGLYQFNLGQDNHPSKLNSPNTGYMYDEVLKGTRDPQSITQQGQQFCLADYCDIFPCDDVTQYATSKKGAANAKSNKRSGLQFGAESMLRNDSFRHRTTINMNIDKKLRKDEWRGLNTVYNRDAMDLLEQKCSKLILDCIDWQNLDEGPGAETDFDIELLNPLN